MIYASWWHFFSGLSTLTFTVCEASPDYSVHECTTTRAPPLLAGSDEYMTVESVAWLSFFGDRVIRTSEIMMTGVPLPVYATP